MENLKKLVGKKIQQRRLELGFGSQEDFANAMDLDQSRVSRWERGESLPQKRYRKKLYEVLKTDESLLDPTLGDENPEKSRAELISEIITALPSLDDRQLRKLVATIQDMAPSSISRKTAAR